MTKKHYKLEADEYICKVDGHFGAWCDNVRFTTNLGREIKAGGNGGSFNSCNLINQASMPELLALGVGWSRELKNI